MFFSANTHLFTGILSNDKTRNRSFFLVYILFAGSKFGYHGVTYGLYADILVQKVDPKGRPIQQVFQEDIAEPFGKAALI